MKKILNLLLLSLISVSALVSCKKDENKIYYEGSGKVPALTFSTNSGTDNVNLKFSDAAKDAITFAWSNPDYKFTTGVSSQDVAYVIEIDTLGGNFGNSLRGLVSYSGTLETTLTEAALNNHFTDNLSLTVGKQYTLQARVIATLSTLGLYPVTSNTVTFTATPYQDPSKLPVELWMTGNATPSDWTNNPPNTQKFTSLGGKKYEITVSFFVPGKFYKFLTKPGAWQPQYGIPAGTVNDGTGPTGGPLGLNDGTGSDPDAIPTPGTTGTYKVSVNLGAMTFKVEKQ